MQSLARIGRKNADEKSKNRKKSSRNRFDFLHCIFQVFFFFFFCGLPRSKSIRSSPYPDRFPDITASLYIGDQYIHPRNHPETQPDRFGRFRATRKSRAIDRLDFLDWLDFFERLENRDSGSGFARNHVCG